MGPWRPLGSAASFTHTKMKGHSEVAPAPLAATPPIGHDFGSKTADK